MERFLGIPQPVRLAIFAVLAAVSIFVGVQAMSGSPDPEDRKPASGSTAPPINPYAGDPEGAPAEATSVTNPAEGVEIELGVPVTDEELEVAARQTIRFAELFTSYRYDEDEDKHRAALNRYVADENTIDVESLFPSGHLRAEVIADRTVSVGDVVAVDATLISETTLVLSVDVEATTTAAGEEYESLVTYTAQLRDEGGRFGWAISDFTLDSTFDPVVYE